MTIDEAIKTLQEILDGTQPTSIIDRRLGIKLGIEALKAVKLNQEHPLLNLIGTLPGETKD